MKYSKIWGNTCLIFKTSIVEVHRIEVDKGGYCSKHCHKNKYNVFYVERGKLKISIYKENDLIDDTIICQGEQTDVSPNIFHRFEALEKTIAYEIYYINLQDNDIVREDQGGINHHDNE
jgi:quercetin dioxygenase-like cupin family protein